jgi:hypothetical protein
VPREAYKASYSCNAPAEYVGYLLEFLDCGRGRPVRLRELGAFLDACAAQPGARLPDQAPATPAPPTAPLASHPLPQISHSPAPAMPQPAASAGAPLPQQEKSFRSGEAHAASAQQQQQPAPSLTRLLSAVREARRPARERFGGVYGRLERCFGPSPVVP